MRPNKLEDLRRERVRWRKQAEERQRFQDKEEEAWEFFCRHATPRPKIREEFEQEFKQKVHEVVCSMELRKMAQRGERKLEARGEKTGQEDANSQCRHTWHKILERAALPPLLRSTHSKDVRLDVQLNIIGLFSGDSFAMKRPSFLIAVDHFSAFFLVLFTRAVFFICDFGVLKTLEIGGVNSLCHASCVHLDDGITIPCFGLCLDWHPSRNSGMDMLCSDMRGCST